MKTLARVSYYPETEGHYRTVIGLKKDEFVEDVVVQRIDDTRITRVQTKILSRYSSGEPCKIKVRWYDPTQSGDYRVGLDSPIPHLTPIKIHEAVKDAFGGDEKGLAIGIEGPSGELYTDVLDVDFSELTASTLLEHGSCCISVKNVGVLKPLMPEISQAHMGGLFLYMTFLHDQDAIRCTLIWHNGITDAPCNALLFKRMLIGTPEGWEITMERPETTYDPTELFEFAGREVHNLIKPTDGLHGFRQRGIKRWDFVLHPEGKDVSGFIGHYDWDVDPEAFSNERGGFQGSQVGVPILQDSAVVFDKWKDEKDKLFTRLEMGINPYGQGQDLGRDAPYSPWYGYHGGITGGNGMDQTFGADILTARSSQGLIAVRALQATMLDRQPEAMFYVDGSVAKIEDTETPVRYFYGEFQRSNGVDVDGDFKFMSTSGFDDSDAYGKSGIASYVQSYLKWNPQDQQHLNRLTRTFWFLLYADGDLASHDLMELFSETTRLAYNMQFAEGRMMNYFANPQGTAAAPLNRKEWFPVQCVAEFYPFASTEARSRYHTWLGQWVDIVNHNMTELGVVGSINDKDNKNVQQFDSLYRVTDPWSSCYFTNALAVIDGATPFDVSELIVRSCTCFRDFYWKPGTGGHYDYVMVAPRTSFSPEELFTPDERPALQSTRKSGSYQLGTVVGHALRYDRELGEELLLRYTGRSSVESAKQALYDEGLKNIESRSPILDAFS